VYTKQQLYKKLISFAIITLGTFASAKDQKELFHPHTIIGLGSEGSFPHFIKDDEMISPKSVQFNAADTTFYLHALEGSKTLAYSFPQLKKISSIKHAFHQKVQLDHQNHHKHAAFHYPPHATSWNGKPVEGVIDPTRNLLYVTSYRRDNDTPVVHGSTLSIIDTTHNTLIASLPTAIIPKVVALSNDHNLLAVANWGDNSLSFWDVTHAPDNITLHRHVQLAPSFDHSIIEPANKDKECGLCLRGTTFTLDDKHLMTSGMHAGGVLYFVDKISGKVSKVTVPFSPIRHIVPAFKLKRYFFSTTGEGNICSIADNEIQAGIAKGSIGEKKVMCRPMNSPVRTLSIHEESGMGVATLNQSCEIAIFELATLNILQKLPAPCYPVGLSFSHNGKAIIVTAQGKEGKGGHKVGVYLKD
jgi:hypothetical protein